MPEFNPQLRRGLTAMSALLLFIGVVGVVVVRDTEKKGDLVAAEGGTTTTLPGDAGDAGDAGGSTEVSITIPTMPGGPAPTTKAPATTARKGSGNTPTTTAKPKCPPSTAPGPSAPASTDPGPTRPPAVGTYCYTFSSTGDGGTRNGDTQAVVESGQDSPGVTRRVTTRSQEDSTLKTTEAWAADGVRQERIRILAGGQDIECDWQPDVLVYAQPLSVGAKWTVDSSCETTVPGPDGKPVPLKLREQGERRVTGRATTAVAGTQVSVWVIETTGTLTVSSGLSTLRTDEVTSLGHFEPTRGLEVYDKTSTKSSGFGGGGNNTTERRLTSLNPT